MAKKRKPLKIIFIIADTLRAQNIGLYGRRPSPSPNIDQLGKRGIVFFNAYGAITKSDPSTVTIMSGKYPLSIGLLGHGRWLPKEQEENLKKTTLLPEILRKTGYKTGAIDWLSRWHKRGYDYYSGKIIPGLDIKKLIDDTVFFLQGLRAFDLITLRFLKRDFFVRFYYCFFPHPRLTYDPADLVVDKAIEFLGKNKKKDLFLYIRFRDPHFPHIRPKGLRSYLFDGIEKRYDTEIKFMDDQIGRFLRYLEKEEITEPLIIFTADHGEIFYEHGIQIAHRGLYDETVRIPLIFYYPKLPVRKITQLVQHVDIFPTILEILGLPVDPSVDGKSLLPLIMGKKKKMRGFAYFEDLVFGEMKIKKSNRKRGIREGRYKYIEIWKGEGKDLFGLVPQNRALISKQELYDLVNDPFERRDLSQGKPLVVKKLANKLQKFVLTLKQKHWQS